MNNLVFKLSLSLLTLFLISCTDPQQTEKTSANTKSNDANIQADGIDWYQGTFSSALEHAKQHGKPILLYWGAEWCPPCNQLKATVFKDRQFIEKTRFFVAVYLNGDDESAQKLGERFAVSGYPSLVVLDPSGEELTRIPGGLQLQRYEEVLDLTLNAQRSITDIIAELSTGSTLADKDYQRLSLYSWSQLPRAHANTVDSKLLYSLYKTCPKHLAQERTRLYLTYFLYLLNSLDENESVHPAVQEEASTLLMQLLSDTKLIMNNLDVILYDTNTVLKALPLKREALVVQWESALFTIEKTLTLSIQERLAPMYSRVLIAELNMNESGRSHKDDLAHIDSTLKSAIIERITWARSQIKTPFEHTSVINRALSILFKINAHAEAKQLLLDELPRAKSPYYFLVDLAKVSKELGNTEAALAQLQAAYEQAPAGATRFQWGVVYLEGLVEMAPENVTAIENLSRELIGSLLARQDAFFNRNALRLTRMQKALALWQESGNYTANINNIANYSQSICNALKPKAESHQRCVEFTEGLSVRL